MKKANEKEIDGEEILKMLEKAWNDFIGYYDKWAPKYYSALTSPKDLSEKKAKKKQKDEHWICWTEDDLMLHLGRFFYKQLYKQLGRNSGIEVHLNKILSYSSFKGYTFQSKIRELNNSLNRKRGVKLDLIITYETSKGPFLLCAEAKFFHYSQESFRRTVQRVIQEDIDRLVALKELGIAENVVFLLFDDYYYLKENVKHKAIKKILEKARKQGITVFYHNSKAKIVRTPHT